MTEAPKPVLRKPRGLLGRGMRTVTIDRRSGRGVRAARNENARPALSQAGGSFFEVQFGKGERGSYPPALTLRSRLKCHRSTTAPF